MRHLLLVPLALTLTFLASAPVDDAVGRPLTTHFSSSPAARVTAPLQVEALGDSVPAGLHCACVPFPGQYARRMAGRLRRPVRMSNDGVSGLTSGGLLSQLKGGPVAARTAAADVVVVMIGANDFGGDYAAITSGRCPGSMSDPCERGKLDALHQRVAQILTRIHALRAGRPTTVLVAGYWNVFEDGRTGFREHGPGGVWASRTMTHQVNQQLSLAATADHDRFVSLYGAFIGHGRAYLTSLLAADGDHPSARGHRVIARVLARQGLPTS